MAVLKNAKKVKIVTDCCCDVARPRGLRQGGRLRKVDRIRPVQVRGGRNVRNAMKVSQ